MIEFTVFYVISVFCFVFPPSAFVSAGITVANLFDSWLGSEDLQFVQYHLRRTGTTVFVHSCLPLGYFCGLVLVEGLQKLLSLAQNPIWLAAVGFSVILPLIVTTQVFFWWRNNWKSHPLVSSLNAYTNNNTIQWTAVASEINEEFRRIDKVTVRTNPVSKTVITSSWIIKVEPYVVKLAHQNHVNLLLENALELTVDRHQTSQYLWVNVEHIQTKQQLFTIRLNALDYADMQDRLQTRINNVRGVTINQDVHARFSKVFIEEVNLNPVFQSTEEMDPCLGCAVNNANIRLVRRCLPTAESACTPCFCRPMWCIHCLSKWFSAKQDAEHPESWLSSRCPCPTCRSPFCILDVSIVETVENI